jgi:hypothetical protein
MSSLAMLGNNYQTGAGVVAAAHASALANTKKLASSTPSVFAATAAASPGTYVPASNPTVPIIPGSYNDPAVIALARQANDACYIQQDAASCLSLNYALASMQAAANCPNGAVTQYINRQKMRGSIEEWLQPPVPYATVKVATNDVANVAVAVGTLPK